MTLRRRLSDATTSAAYGAVTTNARRPSIRTDLMIVKAKQTSSPACRRAHRPLDAASANNSPAPLSRRNKTTSGSDSNVKRPSKCNIQWQSRSPQHLVNRRDHGVHLQLRPPFHFLFTFFSIASRFLPLPPSFSAESNNGSETLSSAVSSFAGLPLTLGHSGSEKRIEGSYNSYSLLNVRTKGKRWKAYLLYFNAWCKHKCPWTVLRR